MKTDNQADPLAHVLVRIFGSQQNSAMLAGRW